MWVFKGNIKISGLQENFTRLNNAQRLKCKLYEEKQGRLPLKKLLTKYIFAKNLYLKDKYYPLCK